MALRCFAESICHVGICFCAYTSTWMHGSWTRAPTFACLVLKEMYWWKLAPRCRRLLRCRQPSWFRSCMSFLYNKRAYTHLCKLQSVYLALEGWTNWSPQGNGYDNHCKQHWCSSEDCSFLSHLNLAQHHTSSAGKKFSIMISSKCDPKSTVSRVPTGSASLDRALKAVSQFFSCDEW